MGDLDLEAIDERLVIRVGRGRFVRIGDAERDALVAVVRASLALDNARTGPDLIAAETAWRAALAPFMEAHRG